MAPKSRPQRPAPAARGLSPAFAATLAAALLALHLALLVVMATRNSVTYDENFHVPAGIVAITRGNFVTSYALPPLARIGPALAALVLVALEGAESSRALPYPLACFNVLPRGPGNGDRILDDSNVDWGKELVVLRADMRRLGNQRVHLAYHGTIDPRLHGIDSVKYRGGRPGPESDWLAISSCFLVGLPDFLGEGHGRVTDVEYRMGSRVYQASASRPTGCLYLFRIR